MSSSVIINLSSSDEENEDRFSPRKKLKLLRHLEEIDAIPVAPSLKCLVRPIVKPDLVISSDDEEYNREVVVLQCDNEVITIDDSTPGKQSFRVENDCIVIEEHSDTQNNEIFKNGLEDVWFEKKNCQFEPPISRIINNKRPRSVTPEIVVPEEAGPRSEIPEILISKKKFSAANGTQVLEKRNLGLILQDVVLNGVRAESRKNEAPKTDEFSNTKTILVASTSTTSEPIPESSSEVQRRLEEFCETCKSSLENSRWKDRIFTKLGKLWDDFKKYTALHSDQSFLNQLSAAVERAKDSEKRAIIAFQQIYFYIRDQEPGIEVPVEHEQKVKKLEKACNLLIKKISELEKTEVDFSAEENSTYIQQDLYTKRLDKIYTKLCVYTKKNRHMGRLLYEKIRFVSSCYNEINVWITKYCKPNKFPSYHDIEQEIRACSKKHDLGLGEAEIRIESTKCFTKLGEMMQHRRRKELMDSHAYHYPSGEDPAVKSSELSEQLRENQKIGDKKLNSVFQEFVIKQETKGNVSGDSDDCKSDTDNEDKNWIGTN